MTNKDFTPSLILAKKSDKKSVLRFYKNNQYSARFIGLDTCYIIKDNDNIIASVIISKMPSFSNLTQNLPVPLSTTSISQYFLHALLVSINYRGQGLAKSIIMHALALHQPLVCFAPEPLSPLYLTSGLTMIEGSSIESSIDAMLHTRFKRYSRDKPNLRVFMSPS